MMHWLRTSLAAHPDDVALMAVAAGVPSDGDVSQHVERCVACSARVARFARAWDDVQDACTTEADAAFTEARLERQRALIQRRLAQHGEPARVIRFPLAAHAARASRQVARRWVAAAAVVGLVVGMAAGRFIDPRPLGARGDRAGGTADRVPQLASPTAAPRAPVSDDRHAGDEAFLVELEMASARPRIEPLRAIDEMTPRIRESEQPLP